MKKEETTFIHRVNHLILNAFPQTFSLVRAENHVKGTKLSIQLYSKKIPKSSNAT